MHLKNIPYEIVEEPLREWTPWMKEWAFANNERARVPVLRYVLDLGVERVMPESNEMNLFLDSFEGNPTYTPQDEEKYKEMQKWWTWCDTELKPMIDLYKYGENLKFNPEMFLTFVESKSIDFSTLAHKEHLDIFYKVTINY